MPASTRAMYKSKNWDHTSPEMAEASGHPIKPRSTRLARFVPASRKVTDLEVRVSKSRSFATKSSSRAGLEARTRVKAFGSHERNRPRGLQNPGNYCYRRAVLQALFHLPAFLKWLEQCAGSHQSHQNGALCLPCSLDTLACAVWQGPSTSTPLRGVDTSFKLSAAKYQQYSWLANTHQADAHEVLSFIVDSLPDSSAVQRLLRLRIGTEWACSDCGHIHTSRLVDEVGLSIGIQTKISDRLEDHLGVNFSANVDEVACEFAPCHSKGTRSRSTRLFSAPDILTIQLVRFSSRYNPRTAEIVTSKNSKEIRYGSELDLSPYADYSALMGGPLKYRLQAVVAHSGSLSSGHYVAYGRGPSGVSRISDSNVSPSSENEMLAPKGGFSPYILFYTAI